jgi:hypothetical protein
MKARPRKKPTKSVKTESALKSGGAAVADEKDTRTLLGQILVELGYITIYQLDEALHIQHTDITAEQEQKPLGQIMLELGYCSPNQLIRAIQVQSDYRRAAVRFRDG